MTSSRQLALAAFAGGCVVAGMFTACSDGRIAGGVGSETTNGTLAARVLHADSTPATGIEVRLSPDVFGADTSSQILSDTTDAQGWYRIPAPLSGNWVVEAREGAGWAAANAWNPGIAPSQLILDSTGAIVVARGSRIRGLVRKAVAYLHDGAEVFEGLPKGSWIVQTPEQTKSVTVVPRSIVDASKPGSPDRILPDSSLALQFLANQEIDLSGGIDTLFLRKEGRIRGLSLQGTRIDTLRGLRHLQFLDTLAIGSTGLNSLPDGIEALGLLQGLHFGWNGNPSCTVDLSVAASSPRLRSLVVNGAAIVDTTASWNARQLRKLDLRGVKLSKVPMAVFRLDSLRVLKLGSNSLAAWPESHGGLGRLDELDVSDNQLDSLGEQFGRIPFTQGSVARNLLRSLPASLLARTDIGWFDVVGNKLCGVDSVTKAWLDARSGSNWQASQVCP